jgi:hypothetical protein
VRACVRACVCVCVLVSGLVAWYVRLHKIYKSYKMLFKVNN